MSQMIKSTIDDIFSKIEFPQEPAGLYDPLRYMISIGGKRIRPSLCLLSYSLFKGTDFPKSVLEPAMALEVSHTFTLIHDDIMDRSELRRSQPTVWKKWNEDTAILSGDVMLIDAYKRIAMAEPEYVADALSLFSDTAAQVCEGQQFDMDFEQRDDVSIDEYRLMIGLKTAVLLACSAGMGALLAGAGLNERQALYDYGFHLGIAFQVADDYLDCFGDEKVFGKPIGGDIIQQKKSWLAIKAMEIGGDKVRKALASEAVGTAGKAAKIEQVRSYYLEYGVDALARETIEYESRRAMEALSLGNFSDRELALLEEFATQLVGRAK